MRDERNIIVTSDDTDDLFKIEVGLTLSEALKEGGTMLVSQKAERCFWAAVKK
jgi:hypothetical protein